MSPLCGTVIGTSSPLATPMVPTVDSDSSVTDDSPNHSDNLSAAPVCVPSSDHAHQAGIVVGLVLVAVIVVTAIWLW